MMNCSLKFEIDLISCFPETIHNLAELDLINHGRQPPQRNSSRPRNAEHIGKDVESHRHHVDINVV